MLFNPGKMTSTSRILFEQNIAMTIVGFPATALLSARARVCISASHTREDLDWALQVTFSSSLEHDAEDVSVWAAGLHDTVCISCSISHTSKHS